MLTIIKAGSTFPAIKTAFGDFEEWTRRGLGVTDSRVVHASAGAPLPKPESCSGVVVMGSHAMVTDGQQWSIDLARWIRGIVERQIPLLGICYGHQLLAHAMGGTVGYHPRGIEIGTVGIERLPEGGTDRLFSGLPDRFPAHATHSQTVLVLPDEAVLLARNGFEPHHGFRIGPMAWGVQFHPEYNGRILRAYVDAQSRQLTSEGRDLDAIYRNIRETPEATALLRKFSAIVEESGVSPEDD